MSSVIKVNFIFFFLAWMFLFSPFLFLSYCMPMYFHDVERSGYRGHPCHITDVSSVQSLSRVWLFATPWTAARQASLSITNSRSLLRPMPIELVMPSSHLILCRPLLLLPPIPPSIRVFSSESTLLMTWPKYWSFSFSISPSNEHPRLISFRMDRLDLLAVQGTLKSLLQHHSSKASFFWCSAFFIVQLSHPYMTTGRTLALTRQTFVGKVMSLLFNMLSRLVITFFPRSKRLLISWLQSTSAVILEPKKIKSATVSIVSPSISHEVMEPDAMILVFWMLSFKPLFSLSSFTFIKRLFSSSSLSAIRVVSSAYLRLLIFLLAILIPAYASSSPAFLMMYSAYITDEKASNFSPVSTMRITGLLVDIFYEVEELPPISSLLRMFIMNWLVGFCQVIFIHLLISSCDFCLAC